MAAINITINGVICDMYGRTITGPVKIVGEAMYTDLGVGGGPMPPGQGGGGSPPSIWPPGPGIDHPAHPIAPGGPPPRPAHPIELPPPSVWPPGPGIDFPSHPIVLPPPVDPGNPIPPGTLINWKTYWSEETGWVVVGVPNVPHPVPSA